jgi:hypothetical protein
VHFRELAEDAVTIYGAFVGVVLERANEPGASVDSSQSTELDAVHSLLRSAGLRAREMLDAVH